MLKLNVSNFTELIKKSTLFYSLNNVYFNFTDKIESKMLSPSKDFAILLNVDNNVLIDNKGEITFNFYEPQENVLPFLKILENNEVNIQVKDNKLVILDGSEKMNIFFCDDSVIDKFNVNMPKIDNFFEVSLSTEMINNLFKLKKFSKFEKLYFEVKEEKIIIEVGDKISRFSNNYSFILADVKYNDLSFCFKSINIMKFLSIMDVNKEWNLKLYSVNDENGMIEFNSNGEKYYFMSKLDI